MNESAGVLERGDRPPLAEFVGRVDGYRLTLRALFAAAGEGSSADAGTLVAEEARAAAELGADVAGTVMLEEAAAFHAATGMCGACGLAGPNHIGQETAAQ